MHPFKHITPNTLPDALSLLNDLNGRAHVNAGGTDLMLKMKAGVVRPQTIINIKRLPELQGIHDTAAAGIRLGTLVTLRELTRSTLIRKQYPALAQAAGMMASEQIRSFATLGGNLCNGSPSADLAPPLIAMEGTAVLVNRSGARQIPLAEFFLGPGKTALQPGELLQEIHLPPPQGQTIYLKHSPRAFMDIAVVGVAARLYITGDICQQARIVLGAVAPIPLRVIAAEQILEGNRVSDGRVQQAAKIAAETCSPIDDVRSSAWYRRRIVEALTRRGLVSLKDN
ncbi:MAG: xanthine dehydrogenase family protein subunit M [Chloroflexi bacterium]|nr:xanthine dehydrogenase family protein subunit M [Chloroflexota bacterium]